MADDAHGAQIGQSFKSRDVSCREMGFYHNYFSLKRVSAMPFIAVVTTVASPWETGVHMRIFVRIYIIDDFKVPGRPDIPYDSYSIHECCFEYVQQKLKQIYSEYTYFYLIPRHLGSRAKLVVIPKKWEEGRSSASQALSTPRK